MGMSHKINAALSRLWALSMSAWGAVLGLFAPTTLPARLHDAFANPMDVINVAVLAGIGLGIADLIWHDIRGRLIWPSFPADKRHMICVWLYALLGAAWLVKAFVISTSIGIVPAAAFMLGFAATCAALCGLVSVSLVLEPRHAQSNT